MKTEKHNIPPVYDENSRVLILGSFPSVKSREMEFFYGHPQNRFWRLMASLVNQEVPESITEKKAFLLKNHIAVWDVIESCEIKGSSDTSIRNVVPNDLSRILNKANIALICCNGIKAYDLYSRYIFPQTGIPAVRMPSTSPANAACSLEDLMAEWNKIVAFL